MLLAGLGPLFSSRRRRSGGAVRRCGEAAACTQAVGFVVCPSVVSPTAPPGGSSCSPPVVKKCVVAAAAHIMWGCGKWPCWDRAHVAQAKLLGTASVTFRHQHSSSHAGPCCPVRNPMPISNHPRSLTCMHMHMQAPRAVPCQGLRLARPCNRPASRAWPPPRRQRGAHGGTRPPPPRPPRPPHPALAARSPGPPAPCCPSSAARRPGHPA